MYKIYWSDEAKADLKEIYNLSKLNLHREQRM